MGLEYEKGLITTKQQKDWVKETLDTSKFKDELNDLQIKTAKVVIETALESSQKMTEMYQNSGKGGVPLTLAVQIILKASGNYQGKLDALSGINTINAIKKWQNKNQLKVDGDAGYNTLQSLVGLSDNDIKIKVATTTKAPIIKTEPKKTTSESQNLSKEKIIAPIITIPVSLQTPEPKTIIKKPEPKPATKKSPEKAPINEKTEMVENKLKKTEEKLKLLQEKNSNLKEQIFAGKTLILPIQRTLSDLDNNIYTIKVFENGRVWIKDVKTKTKYPLMSFQQFMTNPPVGMPAMKIGGEYYGSGLFNRLFMVIDRHKQGLYVYKNNKLVPDINTKSTIIKDYLDKKAHEEFLKIAGKRLN